MAASKQSPSEDYLSTEISKEKGTHMIFFIFPSDIGVVVSQSPRNWIWSVEERACSMYVVLHNICEYILLFH